MKIQKIHSDHDEFYMQTAFLLSKKSKCVSKQVGSVLVKDGRIISMGYNGSHPGNINCDEMFDRKHIDFDDHHKWSRIYEVHSEMNCLSFSAKNGINVNECTLYTTLSPCQDCLKTLLQAGIKRIVFLVQYHRNMIPKEFMKYMSENSIILQQLVPKNMFLTKDQCVSQYNKNIPKLFRTLLEDSIKYHTSCIQDKDLDLCNEIEQRYDFLKSNRNNG